MMKRFPTYKSKLTLTMALMLWSSQMNAYQQHKGDYAYWREMPEAAQVLKDIQGNDKLEIAVRQWAASEVLHSLVNANAQRIGHRSKRVEALSRDYDGVRPKNLIDPGSIYTQSLRLLANRSFTGPFLKRYFSEPALREIEPIVSSLELFAQSEVDKANEKDTEREKFLAKDNAKRNTEQMITIATKILVVGLFAFTLVLLFRRMLTKPSLITIDKLETGGKQYGLYWVTGKVVGQGKFSTTHVSGGGSSGDGYTAPVSSSSTIHNDIFLLDLKGKEHSFQLSGWDVACREGHELTVLWAIRKGKQSGHYIVVMNHTTSEQYFDRDSIYKKMFWNWSGYLIIPVVFSLINLLIGENSKVFDAGSFITSFFIWCGVSLLITTPILAWIARSEVRRFKSSFKFEDYKKDKLDLQNQGNT
ncbi:MAG: hypothetical protein WBD36_06090 [Bacteroidota bacterium]